MNAAAAADLVQVSRTPYDARYPIEERRISTRGELDAPPTRDGNNTGVLACRPTTGGASYSQHDYGLAIDIDPFQNPYVRRSPSGTDLVLPELAASYLQ